MCLRSVTPCHTLHLIASNRPVHVLEMQAMGSLASPAAHPRLLQTPPPTCRFQQYRPFVAANPHTRRPWQRASGKGLQWHVQRASAEPDDAALLAEVPEPEDARGAIAVSVLPVSAISIGVPIILLCNPA